MLFKPNLKVNRLIVLQGSHRALDLKFHAGVNVIRGRNSSGKTTVMDLLAFSLGAENIRWKPEALLCTNTVVEVELNGKAVTLEREISESLKRPMSIFWGRIDFALESGKHRWEQFPFLRTSHRISFSQALFDALEMPQAQGDGGSNLTMHQILRVLYADQPSVHSPIFRLDHFDKPLIRETIGGYLCGVFDDELYSAQLKLRDVIISAARAESELRSIFSILGRSGQEAILDSLDEKIIELEQRRISQADHLLRIKEQRSLSKDEAKSAKNLPENIRKQLNEARKKEFAYKDRLQILELDQADSKMFVAELESRLRNLEESKETRNFFGNLRFQFCPSCLVPITGANILGHHCHLCKQEQGDDRAEAQILRMRNEINIQLKESVSLIAQREEEILSLLSEMPAVSQRLKQLERRYDGAASTWSSSVETAIEEAARELGKLDEEVSQSYDRMKLSSIIADLQEKRDKLREEEANLSEKIKYLDARQAGRLEDATISIANKMKELLVQDLPLQKEFVNPKEVFFDFVENSVYVNGAKNFSESSAVVLRHIFHLALLSASVEKKHMRVPRFLMLDGIDDGGMEKARSHRLQEIIVKEAEKYEVDFQLIFATSEINPKFADSNLVIGKYFTPEARSLQIL